MAREFVVDDPSADYNEAIDDAKQIISNFYQQKRLPPEIFFDINYELEKLKRP